MLCILCIIIMVLAGITFEGIAIHYNGWTTLFDANIVYHMLLQHRVITTIFLIIEGTCMCVVVGKVWNRKV